MVWREGARAARGGGWRAGGRGGLPTPRPAGRPRGGGSAEPDGGGGGVLGAVRAAWHGGARRVRAAGVTVVGVLPTHRRRGVLRSMMRAQLDACREHGESVAYLWATEDTIYGRFGYGVASYSIEVDIPRERSAYHAPAAPAGH